MNMYRPGERPLRPPPFGPSPPLHGPPVGPPFRFTAPFGPPSGHLLHVSRPFPSPGPTFHHNSPTRGHFVSHCNMDSGYSQPHCSSFSIDPAETPNHQIPKWNPITSKHHPTDNSEKAGEEFLRCIAANKPFPRYLKGNMAYNLADAFESANILKEAVKSDMEFRRHVTKSRSRSRSRSQSRKSRAKSRAKSLARSRSRGHSRSRERGKSRGRSRGKSRARSMHRARSKSRARSRSRCWSRSQSRSRSRSWSQKKRRGRSKSRARKSESRSRSSERSRFKDQIRKLSPAQSSSFDSSNHSPASSLFDGLKMVMNSKELEDRMPSLKDAILSIQASDESKKVDCVSNRQKRDSLETTPPLENDMLLPHDRVSIDFSWLQTPSQEESNTRRKDDMDDEESYLYGTEDTKYTTQSFSQVEEHSPSQCNDVDESGLSQSSVFSSFGDSLSVVAANLDSNECEKIKNVLQSLGTADIGDIMVKMQEQMEGNQPPPVHLTDFDPAVFALPALGNTNVRQALESLQSLIKATKEKRVKSDPLGLSQVSSDKHKANEDEESAREKQAKKHKMETLMKELEELLQEDGLNFLIPVIGFFCQKCEEFIGDLSAAESHSAMHQRTDPSSKQMSDSKGPSHNYSNSSGTRHTRPSDRRDQTDFGNYRNAGDPRNDRDQQHDRMDEKDHGGLRNGSGMISLHEEMRKERMLITVSREVAPPPNIKKEPDMEHATGNHSKVDADSKGREKDTSSDSSDEDRKRKSSKVKKKKKEKKKKKREKS